MSRLTGLLALSNLAPRDRRAILLGAAILVPALLWVGAVRPYRAALDDVRERAAAERALLERELALLQADASSLTMADLQTRAARASLRLVSAANVPLAEAEVTVFLQELAQLSRVLLLELRGVEPRRGGGGAIENTALRPIRLAVRGESDLEGVMTFLQRIESSPLLLRVAELSIEPQRAGRNGEGGMDGVVTVSLQLEAYAGPDIDSTTTLPEAGT
ncbi:MAG TPA: type II secretion system protein GspM [Longimicrobiales bacterium]|nr:type II secretion system protein GspM [Longimicrobiales bacterium]